MSRNQRFRASSLTQALSILSYIAIIAGAVFVVFQLRLNARIQRTTASVALFERVTGESFARRRKAMHDIVRDGVGSNWKAFDESLQDFEVRSFAYAYELIGQFVRRGLIDFEEAADFLQYLIVADWRAFEPLSKHLMEEYGDRVSEWQNFQWLAEKTKQRMEARQEGVGF